VFDGMLNAIYLNAGQVCLNAERVYVERSFHLEFLNELVKRVKQLKLGWPEDSSTNMGPLISAEHKKKVLGYFQLAKEEGAVFHVGGGIPKFGDVRDNGFWVEPTVISGLPESARCIKEEIFGPICHITPFDTEEQAIAMANDTHYGLASTIWTTNLSKGHRVAEAMHVGLSWVNCWFLRDLRTPFGGAGLSGIGREGGGHSLNFYSEITNICIKIDRE
jgi:aminomuconate-semialdehyde/2-hydroxymuconate-6-semialdehyde dehydrogenase